MTEGHELLIGATVEAVRPRSSGWTITYSRGDRIEGVTLVCPREPDYRAVVEWLRENMPQALELCPYKVSV